MIYIRGDTHGQFRDVERFCTDRHTKKSDIMIILGDVGLNYFGGARDREAKEFCQSLPITLFCVHGNHEIRPQNIPTYHPRIFHGGEVLAENEYPNLLFAVDGSIFDFNHKKAMVIGGAYSVDKFYRLANGMRWFRDEQPDDETKKYVENVLDFNNWQVDAFLTHTCPWPYIPSETFIEGIDQATVDESTERWLASIEKKAAYQKWFCGHYHINKAVDKIWFLFTDTIPYVV